METAFILKSSEINPAFFKAMNILFGNDSNLEITIRTVKGALSDKPETKEEYFARLKRADENVKKGNVIRFTAKEFKALSQKLSGK